MASSRTAIISWVSGSRCVFLRIVWKKSAARSESEPKMEPSFSSAVKLVREGVNPWRKPVFIALLISFSSFDRGHDRFGHAAVRDKLCTQSTHFLQQIPA